MTVIDFTGADPDAPATVAEVEALLDVLRARPDLIDHADPKLVEGLLAYLAGAA
jgi:hypothetical protein